jgi:hypothetical protein
MPNAIINLNQYNENCLFFCEPIKNNVMTEGEFSRIIYADTCVTMNSIFLKMPFNVTGVCKYYSKYKYTIELTNEINKIKQMEVNLVQKMNKHNKIPQHNIYDHLLGGCIKISDTPPTQLENTHIILKISGIWETETECGITYKFIVLE